MIIKSTCFSSPRVGISCTAQKMEHAQSIAPMNSLHYIKSIFGHVSPMTMIRSNETGVQSSAHACFEWALPSRKALHM
jgi:hypothetical protein